MAISNRLSLKIHPIFWIVAALIGLMTSSHLSGEYLLLGVVIWVGIVFVSVLIHEGGHAFTALAFGQKAHVELVAMGGLTHRTGKKLKLWQDFLVVLNGPLAGFCLYLVALYAREHVTPNSLMYYIFFSLERANLFWTILNLLPVYPLDGGHLFSIILNALFGMKGMRASFLFSCCFSALLGLYFFVLEQSLLIGSIFMFFAFENYRSWQGSASWTIEDSDESLQQLMEEAEKDLRLNKKEEALSKLDEVRRLTGKGKLYQAATEYEALLKAKDHDWQGVYHLLYPNQKQISVEAGKLLQEATFHLGQWGEVVDIGTRLYQSYPHPQVAITNALSHGKLGEAQAAAGWFLRAVEEGLPNPKEMVNREEFDTVRNLLPFQKIRERFP